MAAQQPPAAPQAQMWVCELGLVPYGEALVLQQRLSERRQADQVPDTLLLLEHPPTYTRGRRAAPEELALGEAFYPAHGIEGHETDRGGRLTYPRPGPLVGHPHKRVSHVS